MKKITLLIVIFMVSSSYADPFSNNDLFVGKSVKLTGGSISAGVEFQIAPVKALLKSQINNIIDEGCKGAPDPNLCKSQVDTILDSSKYVPDSVIDDARNNPELLKQELLKSEYLSDQQKAEVQKIDFTNSEVSKSVSMLADTILDKEKAVTFAFEPFCELNLDLLAVAARLPLAGFYIGGDTEFAMGNLMLDAKFGHIWDLSLGSVGLSYGASFYFPTGSSRANSLALSNIFLAPKYYHEYLTIVPFLVAGLDLQFVIIQAEAEFFNMIGVRGSPLSDYPAFLKYGGGLSIGLIPTLMIVGEINGLTNIKDASPMSAVYLTGGLKFNFAVVKVGVAVQVPLAQKGRDAYASFGGLDFGSPSNINFIVNASLGW